MIMILNNLSLRCRRPIGMPRLTTGLLIFEYPGVQYGSPGGRLAVGYAGRASVVGVVMVDIGQ